MVDKLLECRQHGFVATLFMLSPKVDVPEATIAFGDPMEGVTEATNTDVNYVQVLKLALSDEGLGICHVIIRIQYNECCGGGLTNEEGILSLLPRYFFIFHQRDFILHSI